MSGVKIDLGGANLEDAELDNLFDRRDLQGEEESTWPAEQEHNLAALHKI